MLIQFFKRFRFPIMIIAIFSIGLLMSSKNSEPETNYKTSYTTDVWVYICVSPTAYAYHDSFCNGLNNCTHQIDSIPLQEAKQAGRKPCKICY